MTKAFKISLNRSKYSSNSRIHILNTASKDADPLVSIGVAYLAYCELEDFWLIERDGKSESIHIDIFLGIDGCFDIESSVGKFKLRANETAIIPSWISRRLSINNGASKHLYVRIEDVKKYPHINGIGMHKTAITEELIYYCQRILQAQGLSSDTQEYNYHLFSMVQLLLHRELWGNQDEISCKLDRLFQMINSSNRRQSVAALAKKFGVSVSSFYKLCIQHYGKSPSQIINEINMRKAADLLHYSDLSIDNIAEQMGYANQFAFSKAFKKTMKVPPSKYYKNKN